MLLNEIISAENLFSKPENKFSALIINISMLMNDVYRIAVAALYAESYVAAVVERVEVGMESLGGLEGGPNV